MSCIINGVLAGLSLCVMGTIFQVGSSQPQQHKEAIPRYDVIELDEWCRKVIHHMENGEVDTMITCD